MKERDGGDKKRGRARTKRGRNEDEKAFRRRDATSAA